MSRPIAVWTDDRVASLIKLWKEGYFASQIAKELGGVTRNAILGKIFRLGLSCPKVSVAPRKNEPREEPAARPKFVKRKGPFFGPVENMKLRCAEVDPLHKSLIDLEKGECRYPYGDGPFTFCGHQTVPIDLARWESYCPAHDRLTRRGTHNISEESRAILRSSYLRRTGIGSNHIIKIEVDEAAA